MLKEETANYGSVVQCVAEAYNSAALKRFGEFAHLNDIAPEDYTH